MVFLFSCGGDDTDVLAENNSLPKIQQIMGIDIVPYEEYHIMCAEYEQTTKKVINDLYINDIPVPYDSVDNTYYVTVASGKDRDKYKLTYDGEDVVVKFVETPDLSIPFEELISQGKSYKLFVYNETNYALCKLVFTFMPVMTIDNFGKVDDIKHPIGSEDVKAAMTLTDAKEQHLSDIIINIRGGSSRAFPKLGYKINLVKGEEAQDLNLLDMREDDDWVLIPIYTDESKIRDRMSYDLWSSFGALNNNYGIHNGVKIKYIELIINGHYWGLYGLVVPVDKNQQQISDKKGEILLKTESWEIPSSEKLRATISENAVDSIVMKHPQTANRESWNITADLVELIYESDDDVFSDQIAGIVDIGNVLDYWILVNVISGEDNAWKNMYITFKRDNNGYTALVCPWDCDLSWGVTWDENAPLFWQYRKTHLVKMIGAGDLPNRIILLDINGARKKLQTRWKTLRRGILSDDELIKRVDALTNEIKEAGTWNREIKRWPSGGHVDDDNTYMKGFIKDRMAFLDEYIEKINK